MNNSYFSAIVIGNDRLSIMGAECLISEGNCQLHALISLCVYAEDWAKRNNIPWFRDFNSFIQSPASSQPFDYLFNIAHFEYLPDFVLRMPKKLAINYHDALLPKYAGMHATSWALLNGETSHGITWHVITEKIDAGPILTQDQIPISEDDTALTLNLKCYQQAISSFRKLIVNLSSANIILKPQDLSLRTYFGRYKPFPFAGIISWETTSEEIDRVCRALDFGEYDNTLCSAKFVIHNCYYLLAKYELYSPSKDMPGTIVDFNRQFIQIATKSNDIRLLAIDDMYGCRISIPEFIDRHNITKGMLLHSLSIASIDKICLSIASIIKHEHFWVSELRKINSSPVLFIHQNTYSNSKKATQYESITLNIMDKLIYLCQPSATIVETKLAVILAYLYRLNNCDAFTVSFSHPSIKTACEDEDLLSPFVPFSIDFNSLDPFENILLTVKNTYNKIVKNKTFQKDIFARYKNIKKTELPISITIINEDEDCLFINSHINFSMNVTTYAMRVYFSPEYIKFSQQLISYLEIFMSSVCKKFFEEIRYQSLIPNNEKNKMLVEWNATTIDYPKNIGLHELFERQVKKTPNNLAIIFEDQEITYNELNQISNQLAHYIIKNKDKKNTNIIIYLERNLDAIISMLAILKSGNSYICIAPDAPLIQIQEIIMDCKTDVIITQEHLATHLKSHRVGVEAAIKIINLDAERVIISSEDKQNIISRVINQTAYILYTSGSTGKPKGVQIKHNSIVNLLLAMRHEVHFTAKDVLLALTPTTFDISGLEIYLPLISGAHFILATNPVRLDPTLIIKKIDQHNITIMQATPATWQMLVDVHWENKTKIKILCGGEGLSKRLSLKLGSTGAHFWNLYGPTETTIWSTIYSVKKHSTNITLELIGKPIANTKAYVLDKNLQLVPIGIVGTLWIAGDGVAIGYLNKPELTCKNFIADPFSNEPDCRMYNTGDQVKWLPDGNLEYIGRIDDQIKIRGLRIELGEINACLQEYPEIAQSIVISDGASPPNTKIIAYIILHNKASYNQDSLINYLKADSIRI